MFRDVFNTLNVCVFFFPIMSAFHYFTYPQRLTVSFNVKEHRQVNHYIFSLSSPAQAKVNLPLVHYRHDTGTPRPPPPHTHTHIGPSGEGRDVGCGGERERDVGDGEGGLRGGFERILYAALCIAFMLSSR